MSHQTPIMFDKYLLLDRIAIGGMAEVYRAKLIGEKGFEKPVVVKKLLPHLIEDKEMETLLTDEARLAAQLEHENITHVHDFGLSGGTLFIAMEYLFGKDLNQVIRQGQEANRPMDLENVLHVTSRIAEGLGYAHRLTDLDGKSLGVIHRDVSPHNVFITYEGQVKLIDFGIAKAATRSTRTQTGIIKGKVAYMSPEQAEGKKIDHRSDIFPIGIILYELVTGTKMFAGDTFQVLSKVVRADYRPPEEIVSDLPPGICQIIRKALQRDPDDRYATCEELADDIQDCIYDLQYRPGTSRMAVYMQSLFEGRYELEKLEMAEKLRAGIPEKEDDRSESATGYQPTVAVDTRSHPSEGDVATEIMGNDNVTMEIGQAGGTVMQSGKPALRRRQAPKWTTAVLFLVMLGLAAGYFLKPEDETAFKIEQLLIDAHKSDLEERILAPADDSSLYYYREVLKLDPQNGVARQGIQNVADACYREAMAEIEKPDLTAAREKTETLRSIDPKNHHIRELENRIASEERRIAAEEAARQKAAREEAARAQAPPPSEPEKKAPAKKSSGNSTRQKVERDVRSVVNRVKGIFK